jgi:hypothetical protein
MKSSEDVFAAAMRAIPQSLLKESGKVFYSGRSAFASRADLYLLGINPGGDPVVMRSETIASHMKWIDSAAPSDWSAYRDESWRGKVPGCHGMQPRVLHMFRGLGLNPGAVPASNLIFVRSRRKDTLVGDARHLAGLCWPFHQFILDCLQPKVIVCFGKPVGNYVRQKTNAHQLHATFTEQNDRKWQSHSYHSPSGVRVVVATHPGIADWTTSRTDPTGLVASALHDA